LLPRLSLDPLSGLLERLADLAELAGVDVAALALDHLQEMVNPLGLARVADIAAGAIGRYQGFALRVKDREPGDATGRLGLVARLDLFTSGHAVDVDLRDDEVAVEDRRNLGLRHPVVEPVTPAAPGRAKGQEDPLVVG
jgi:hypothetical protein